MAHLFSAASQAAPDSDPVEVELMRIGIVTQSYHPVIGGVTEHVQGLAVSLLRQGHRVTVITGNHGGPTSPEEDRLRGLGGEVARVGRIYRLRYNGATVTTVGEPGMLAGLRRWPRDAFDVVHIHSPFEPLLPIAAAFWFDSPIVGTFHSAGRSVRGYEIFKPLLRRVMDRLSLRTAVSATARDFVGQVFPDRCLVSPNGIELDRFRPPGNSSTPFRSPTRLLLVGRLDPRKGHEVIFDALERLPSSRELAAPLVLDIVGDGPLRKRLQRRSHHLPVRFWGSLSARELALRYHGADLVLAPAQYGESFGVVLLEAMAAGRPLLASDLAGYRETIGASGAGDFVRADDADAWARGIADLVASPDRRTDMGRAGLARVARFSWPRLAREMERLYRTAGQTDARKNLAPLRGRCDTPAVRPRSGDGPDVAVLEQTLDIR